jgi:hypothetical protein
MKRLEPPFKGKSKLITIKYTIHDPKLFLIPILNFFSIPYNDPAPEPQLGQGRAERLREWVQKMDPTKPVLYFEIGMPLDQVSFRLATTEPTGWVKNPKTKVRNNLPIALTAW